MTHPDRQAEELRLLHEQATAAAEDPPPPDELARWAAEARALRAKVFMERGAPSELHALAHDAAETLQTLHAADQGLPLPAHTYERLGQALALLRRRAGYSQGALALLLETSRGTVRHYEASRRKPPLDVLHKWALLCGRRLELAFPPLPGGEDRDARTALRHELDRVDEDLVNLLLRLIRLHRRLPEPIRQHLRDLLDLWAQKYGEDPEV